MTKKLIIKNILSGFLSWLIPFALSIPFFTPNGELVIPYDLFKSMMIVIGSISGCYLLFRYFRLVDGDFIRNGIIVGFSWFVINIILDSIILIPMMKVTFANYLISIGLRYTVLPVIGITIGYLLNQKVKV